MTKTALLFAQLLVLGACATNVSPPADRADEQTYSFAEDYKIGIGDNLQIHVFEHPDLSVNVPVRPDGKVTVPVAGDVFVGGYTPEAVSEQVAQALSEYVRDPIVTTTVTGLGASEFINRVRVTGAVGRPASIQFRNGMTVLDVVLDAGGITEFAKPSKTVIYRANGERLPVRLDRILREGDLSTNHVLRPGDIVTVPEGLF